MNRHNFRTVFRFELVRTLKKKSYWASTLLVPVVMGIVIALITFSGATANESAAEQKNSTIAFEFVDDSGLISDGLAAEYGGTRAAGPVEAAGNVLSGETEAFFHYPEDPTAEPVRIQAQDAGLFNNGKYSAVARTLIRSAAAEDIGSPELVALAAGSIGTTETMYKDGAEAGGFESVLAPLGFLAVFYLLILFMGNQIVTSVVEEKENRVSEMILTTLNPTTLVLGKIAAILTSGAFQVAVFGLPVAVGMMFPDRFGLGGVPLPQLGADPWTMAAGAALLVAGFALFAGTLVALGAVMPTAKEANGVFGMVVILNFVPLYAVPLVLSDPDSPVVQLFTFFPYSAPVTAMLRNSLGSLDAADFAIVLTELVLMAVLVFAAAVKLFRHGSIQYTAKVRLWALTAR